jgi:hypothetical protein
MHKLYNGDILTVPNYNFFKTWSFNFIVKSNDSQPVGRREHS